LFDGDKKRLHWKSKGGKKRVEILLYPGVGLPGCARALRYKAQEGYGLVYVGREYASIESVLACGKRFTIEMAYDITSFIVIDSIPSRIPYI
jgi:hypothetical protein